MMRISTNMIYDSSVSTMNQQQSRLLQTQQQLATGKRLINPSIDPAAAVQAMDVTQADAINTQYAANRISAQNTLTQMDITLQGATSLLQTTRESLIQASNTGTDTERQGLATALESQLQQLVSLANTKDGTGAYLFSGFQSKTQPFAGTVAGYAYFGDAGQKSVQISSGQQVPTSISGADIFMRVPSGNGTFVTQAAATNTGGGVATQGSAVNSALLTGNSYSLSFTVAAGVTTYSVTNTTTATPVAGMTGLPYTGGQAISFDGMQFAVSGAPVNGDSFTVQPSSNVSLFQTIADTAALLRAPVTPGNPAQTAALNAGVAAALKTLDTAMQKISVANAGVGSTLQGIDVAQVTGDNLGLNYKQTLSQLQDTNFAQAATDLAQQQLALQAAQKSFAQVSGLSLFTYL